MILLPINKVKTFQSGVLAGVLICGLLIGGCASHRQAREVEQSGFLSDYSMLREGKHVGEEEVLIYVNPEADWTSYNKVLLDPTIFYQQVENPGKVPPEDLQHLVNNFTLMLKEELSKDFKIVDQPGAEILRIQVAITDAEKTDVIPHTVSSIVPVGIVVQAGTDFITGKPAFVGEVSVEFKIEDAGSGTLLVAGVDRRVGGRRIKTQLSSWDDVNRIMEYWSKQLVYRLCQLQGRTDCVKP